MPNESPDHGASEDQTSEQAAAEQPPKKKRTRRKRKDEPNETFVKLLSRPLIAITANGVYGSTIASYRTTFDGVTYTDASFITNKALSTADTVTATITVTDTRGRTLTRSTAINALD